MQLLNKKKRVQTRFDCTNKSCHSAFCLILLLTHFLQEEKKRREELMGQFGTNRTIEERVDHYKQLQYEKHEELFSVQYTSIHKVCLRIIELSIFLVPHAIPIWNMQAAYDNSVHGMKYFLNRARAAKNHVDDYDKNGSTPLHIAAER